MQKHQQPIDDLSSRMSSEDNIIRLSWRLYEKLQSTLPLESFPQLKSIYNDLTILEDICISNCLTPEERKRIEFLLNDMHSQIDMQINLFDITKRINGIIKFLKMNDLRSKALILIDQIGQQFFQNSKEDFYDYEQKLQPVKEVIKNTKNLMKYHALTHSIKRIDRLFNESIPAEYLPKDEILQAIDSLINEVA